MPYKSLYSSEYEFYSDSSVTWSGYTWALREQGSSNPGPNLWEATNAVVNDTGQLVLTVNQQAGSWYCAEAVGPHLGYGKYSWQIASPVHDFDRHLVLSLFVYDETAGPFFREIDLEIAQFSAAASERGWMTLQPGGAGKWGWFNPGDSQPSTFGFTWAAGKIRWEARDAAGRVVETFLCTTDVPTPGTNALVRMNLWLFGGTAPTDGLARSVVFDSFTFTAAAPVADRAPTAHLVDTFSYGGFASLSQPTAKGRWTNTFGATAPAIVGSRARLTLTSGAAAYTGIGSGPQSDVTRAFDLTASEVLLEWVTLPAVGNGTTEAILHLKVDPDTDQNLLVMAKSGTQLITRWVAAGVANDTYITFDDVQMRWWRVRHSGATVFWETSPNGTSWTTRRSVATPITITALFPYVVAGHYGTEPAPGIAEFDNFNVPSSGIVTGTQTYKPQYRQDYGFYTSKFVPPDPVTFIPLLPDSRELSGRRVGFRYDLLDVETGFKKTLESVSEAEVEFNSGNAVSRTATFSMKDDPDINWFSDRIQPVLLIQKPFTTEVEQYPLGVFSFLSPPRRITAYGAYRDIQAYDMTQELDGSPFTANGFVVDGGNTLAAGQIVTEGAEKIIIASGIPFPTFPETVIDPSDETLPTASPFELGSSRLEAINKLLDQIGYFPLYTNGRGQLLSQEIPLFAESEPTIEYATDDDSWVQYPLADSLDISRIWNCVLLLAESPNGLSKFRSLLKNTASSSPISTTSLGREIWAPTETLQDISSQAQLDKIARVRLQQGTDLFQIVEFETPIESQPESFTIVRLIADVPGQDEPVSGTFVERQWSIQCKPGGTMSHTLHRIVTIEDVEAFV